MTKNVRLAAIILIGWYYVLITAHYFGQRPLWNDEQCILNNITGLKPSEIFSRPLLNLQEFPRLYLWGIQQFSCHFDYHLLALRFFPWVAMGLAFPVWLKVFYSQSRDQRTFLLFIGCWCASVPLVYHAGELKPYSMDVLASGLFVLFLCHQHKLQNHSVTYRSLLFLLPLLGLVSYPVIFLYPLPLYNLVREGYLKRRLTWELVFYLGGGLSWASFVYFFDYRVTMTGFLQKCWGDYFISFNSAGVFFETLGKGISNIISRWFAERPKWIECACRFWVGVGLFYMLVNFGKLFKAEGFRFRSLLPAAFAVFWMHLILGAFHKYPFSVPRLSLFFAPFLLGMTVLAMKWLREKYKLIGTAMEIIFTLYLAFISLGIAKVVFACNPLFPHSGPGLGGESALWQGGS